MNDHFPEKITDISKTENLNINKFQHPSKRAFDLLFSILLFILLSPFFLFFYLIVKLDGGSAFYGHERVGKNGKTFKCLKFRSMASNSQELLQELLASDPQAREEWNSTYKLKNDPRITKIGQFLRKSSLDEMPQLINIMKGEMSFVGPRPERKYYIDQIMEHNPDYTKLYALRPGLFSYATLYNGYTDTMEKMLKRLDYDLQYLEDYSFWTDIKIIYLTSISIIFGKKF